MPWALWALAMTGGMTSKLLLRRAFPHPYRITCNLLVFKCVNRRHVIRLRSHMKEKRPIRIFDSIYAKEALNK